jgi:hypothetical protein
MIAQNVIHADGNSMPLMKPENRPFFKKPQTTMKQGGITIAGHGNHGQ